MSGGTVALPMVCRECSHKLYSQFDYMLNAYEIFCLNCQLTYTHIGRYALENHGALRSIVVGMSVARHRRYTDDYTMQGV